MINELTSLLRTYAEVLDAYGRADVSSDRDRTDKENQQIGADQDEHYLDIGRDALRLIVSELVANHRAQPQSILDVPSGSGRVTRHLRAAFPTARIGACDLYESHVQFCVDTFAAEAIASAEDFDDVRINPEWDLVFCGSLLTHLPKPAALSALRFIARALSPTGIAIVTLEGRRGIEIHNEFYKVIEDDQFQRIQKGYDKTGFGFADYTDRTKRLFNKQESYGITLVKPSWVMDALENMDVRILGYTERAWDNHQDMVVFGRPGPTGLGH
ncbi:MAG: trans-aconitate 2-methyltransferase [Ilumatobacter sp.]